MKTFAKTIAFLILICFLLYLPGLIPIKFAIKQNDLNNKKEYILVEEERVTGFDWVIIGDQTGYYYPLQDDKYRQGHKYRPGKYIQLTGKIPVKGYPRHYHQFGDNIYVCYGKYIGTDTVYDGTDIFCGEEYKIYEVDDWDILYPINRDGILEGFVTKSYLSLYDKLGI